MVHFKKKLIRVIALLGAASFTFGACMDNGKKQVSTGGNEEAAVAIKKVHGAVKTNQEDFYDDNVVFKVPETVEQNQEISVIVSLNSDSLTDLYQEQSTAGTAAEYLATGEAKAYAKEIAKNQDAWIKDLKKSGISYKLGERYDTVLNGFEVTVKAKDFEALNKVFDGYATLMIGDEYAPATVEPVHNYVDVYETGIFDSSKSKYQGDGVVVAVLDTGLDYTHSAFSVKNFVRTQEAFTLSEVSQKIKDTAAAKFSQGLTGEDVYVNAKVPFAYDYADKDPDVLPINSEHGTHVAGIIAGKDDRITGVAPSAQLAIMKVFSDAQQGAKDSWIIAALEDCVALGVDVINMSLGAAGGFTREVDKENKSKVYDKVREVGISLIAAAGNDTNATYGSKKNGSNGLTSNPDSGPIGAPSTYESALSVASVDGVKTPYLRYQDDIMYYTEATASDSKPVDFVGEILKTVGNVESYDFEYVTIPGIGRSSDYPETGDFYKGKIVLVKRGTTTFEDKVRVALIEKGAAGIIIYNNVSGKISMSVGKGIGAVCSISQDEGEKLAAAGTGIITVSKKNAAGPFMSDFSSWGPTSDLKIKPEITGHGGEIESAVPGGGYDRLSGTSMAAPNLAGAAALIRQYVKFSGVFGTEAEMEADPVRVTKLVNQLMMSTADIVMNKNGLPYAVRKQGSGLVSISDSTTTAAYISTYENGVEMDKSKLELGDDKNKTGIYKMSFAINNISKSAVTYDLGAIVMTEGVSTTYTSHGDTTVTQEGYILDGAQFNVLKVTGNGKLDGTKVSVDARKQAMVEVEILLSDSDKAYMDESFENGMYVEGFITFKATEGTTVDMNVPYLAFYGDWTQAPIFDEEYYDTHKDEINAGIDEEDKLMADTYATRVIGGLYSDYITTLGSYYFVQDPTATQIAASKDKISLSNQEKGGSSSVNKISDIWAGLLRNVKEWNLTIVEDATGEVIWTKTGYNQRKSTSGGGTVYQSSMDVDFSAIEHNLKNNTKYTVRVESYIDYGTKEEQKNARNVFEFPLYIDFQAPIITNVQYRTEYDKTEKKTHLYADFSVYDNHYAMGMQLGQIVPDEDPSNEYLFTMKSFGKYVTPVYSTYNSTTLVTVELTDYVAMMKNSATTEHDRPTTGSSAVYNSNSFIVNCYDYAMNSATYEIDLPDEILSMYFNVEDDMIKLSPNETLDLSTVLNIFPAESWLQVLDFESSDPDKVAIVNQTVIAKESGEATVTAIGYDSKGNKVTASVQVKVLAPGEEGYVGGYSVPEINKFTLTGYKVNKAYYSVSTEEREIGLTSGTYDFSAQESIPTLSMFPSESVNLLYTLDSYFPEKTNLKYEAGNSRVATVDENGTIVAQSEGTTTIFVTVQFKNDDGTYHDTFYSARVSIKVKDPYTTNSIYLMSYKGNGGEVRIPDDRGITTIYAYAFSNYEYVEKDLDKGDVIDEEDPYHLKQQYIGDSRFEQKDRIKKVIIPAGVTHINEYAFAGLVDLEEVVIEYKEGEDTVVNIGVGAFKGCTKLKKINLQKVQFINESAFSGCALTEIDLSNINAIGNYAFEGCKLNGVSLPESSQSLGIGAFKNNKALTSVEFLAPRVKIGSNVFEGCSNLISMDINAAVISAYAFDGCTKLKNVNFGKDVAVIGEFAFRGTNVSKFTVDAGSALTLEQDGALVLKDGELLVVAPNLGGNVTTSATSIATGAFSANTKIYRVYATNVEKVGAYAFAECTNLREVQVKPNASYGDYAFAYTGLQETPDLSDVMQIGKYAFAGTKIASVTIADNANVGDYAFCYNQSLKTVTVGNNVTLGEGAFYCPVMDYTYNPEKGTNSDKLTNTTYYKHDRYIVEDENGEPVEGGTFDYYYYQYKSGVMSTLESVAIGNDTTIGKYAFAGNAKMKTATFGQNVKVGDYAFFNNAALENVDLSTVVVIGEQAFSGARTQAFCLKDNAWNYAYEYEYYNGELRIKDYMYTSFAPVFTTADLSSATSVGIAAFMNNKALDTIIFGENLTEVTDYAFAYCGALAELTIPQHVTKVGVYSFYGAKMQVADLSNVDTIGGSAFARTFMKEITLKEGVELGNYAFGYCYALETVNNLDKVATIGAGAFRGVALTEADLSGATLIGDMAFAESALTKVTFGKDLATLGENPFYMTEIKTYGKETPIVFNDKVVGTEMSETYNVNDNVKVVNGVLYQKVANGGWELISYPMAKEDKNFVVEEGTVRITARAFANSAVENVTLPTTLKALGDKAFYGCENLQVVVFSSYQAPIFEEEYDVTHLTFDSLPMTGYLGEYEGLGISPYYMWNVTSNFTNFYFGANFVDYIGKLPNKLVMVKPANGQQYDTFIISQYFGAVVEGVNATMDVTLQVIAMIEKLPNPEQVTLQSEAAIVAARAAFNGLPDMDQQALVTNYSRLDSAEKMLNYLKSLEEDTPIEEKPVEEGMPTWAIVLIVVGGVLVAGGAGVAVWFFLKKKANGATNAAEVTETTDVVTEEALAEDVAETEEVEETETVEETVEQTEEVAEESADDNAIAEGLYTNDDE